jgi:hypothetical protein
MKPLNPTDVIWLAGSGQEIDLFLKSDVIREHAIVLGHPNGDAKRTLLAAAQPGPSWEINFKPLLAGQDLEIVFLLVQGKIMGLVKQTAKEAIAA